MGTAGSRGSGCESVRKGAGLVDARNRGGDDLAGGGVAFFGLFAFPNGPGGGALGWLARGVVGAGFGGCVMDGQRALGSALDPALG